MAKLNFKTLSGAYACSKMRESELYLKSKASDMAEKYKVPCRIAAMELCSPHGNRMTQEQLQEYIRKELDPLPYQNEVQKEKDVHIMARKIFYYLNAEERTAFIPEAKTVNMEGYELEVIPDCAFKGKQTVVKGKAGRKNVFEDIPEVEVTKILYKKPNVSTAGRTMDTSVYQNLQIYGMLLMAKELAKEAGCSGKYAISASFVFLKNKEDKEEFTKKQYVKCTLFYQNGELTEESEAYLKGFRIAFEKYRWGVKCNKTTCSKCPMVEKCNYKETPRGKEQTPAEHHISDYKLSDVQKKIVSFDEGVARVNAGAGAGKTLVTALNVVSLIIKGELPNKILLITFTNAGAMEMRVRARNLLADYGLEDEAEQVVITTFNSFGDQIIHSHWRELGYTQKPKLLKEIKAIDLCIELLKGKEEIEGLHYEYDLTMDLPSAKGVVTRLLEIFSEIKSNRYSLEEFKDVMYEDITSSVELEKVYQLYEEYQCMMKERNRIQYQDQENLVFDLLEQDSEVFEKMGFEHIIVDEFQDSNKGQMLLIKKLMETKAFKSLMVVGDDSQSIFGFRGTSPENIINFDKILGTEVKDFQLTDNYRSTPEIISAANAVNDLITVKLEKELISRKASGAIPRLYGFEDQKEEIPQIAGKIKKLVEAGVANSDIAFIARTKKELLLMQDALTKIGVYALPEVPVKMLDTSKVQATIGLAKFFMDREVTQGLYLYLNAVMNNELGTDKKAKDILNRNKKWADIQMDTMDDQTKKDYFFILLDVLNDGDDIYDAFVQEIKDEYSASLRTILETVIKFETYESKAEASVKGDLDAVCLTTYHSSKGREWDYAFVSLTSLDNTKLTEDADETRRLVFVGVTRARKALTVSSVKEFAASSACPRAHKYYYELLNTGMFEAC